MNVPGLELSLVVKSQNNFLYHESRRFTDDGLGQCSRLSAFKTSYAAVRRGKLSGSLEPRRRLQTVTMVT